MSRPEEETRQQPVRRSWLQRLLWFAGLWLAGLVVVGGGAYGLRALISLLY